MRRFVFAASLCLSSVALHAQAAAAPAKQKALVAVEPATPAAIKDLPVHKVVLYKNGVGYFEHSGTVNGNQRVAIDFTSPQLNDVLQSLTVLDQGGGHISGVNYNSTTPLAEQLKSLSLGMGEDPTATELFQALRGQRVEVTGGPGGPITGRLMSIETRTQQVGAGNSDSTSPVTVEKFYLTVIAGSGAVRVIELTPQLSVRPLDANLQGQLDRYLELLNTTHANGLRHLTLNALGQGQRDLMVSYISEVPVWKSTYRMVFPREANGKAILQGWVVVDNTVGADWDNVQLSLVAGAPQSFIQPLSQPLYTRRPEIPISTEAQLTPQTHEAAESAGGGTISGTVTDQAGAVIPNAVVTATGPGGPVSVHSSRNGEFNLGGLATGIYTLSVSAPGFQTYRQTSIAVDPSNPATVDVNLNVGAMSQTVNVESSNMALAASPRIPASMQAARKQTDRTFGMAGMRGSRGAMSYGVIRASDALQTGDVTTNAFDDYFQYSITQPVTIHKNESAMVPILQENLPAEHVTLWSQREPMPLRAVWLENTSKLTLDAGSFSIFENSEFAGEGLLDPIHPGERRLLSYAADQAVRVRIGESNGKRNLSHVEVRKGIIIETHMDVASQTYVAVNSADEARSVLIEHPRRQNGWSLDDGIKADETAPSLYRFKVPVAAHSTAKFEVREHGPEIVRVDLNANQNQTQYLLDLVKRVPDALDKLQPVIDAQTAIAALDARLSEATRAEVQAAADEGRARDNLTALKGNEAAKRFVDELNRAEDALQSARKQTADLNQQKQAAISKLNATIAALDFDWSVTVR
jgi:hypothetical protein